MMMMNKHAARSRLEGTKQPVYDPLPVVREHEARTAEEIVDYYCRVLLSRPLDAAKREQLVSFLNGGPGKTLDIAAKDAPDRIRTTVHLICSTPEYQMN